MKKTVKKASSRAKTAPAPSVTTPGTGGRRAAVSRATKETRISAAINLDGTGDHKLTSGYGLNTSPAWSPDGSKLAFVSNRKGSPQLYVMPSSGGEPTRLTFQGNYNQTPDWSPRGDLIAFTARDERSVFDLFTIAVEGGKMTRLTEKLANNEEPTFAPNGRLVAFISARNGGSDLYVMGIDGSNPRQLTRGALITTPAWGPLR